MTASTTVRHERGFGDVSGALTTWSNTPYPRTDPVWQEATHPGGVRARARRVRRDAVGPRRSRHAAAQQRRQSQRHDHHARKSAGRAGVTNGGFGTLGGVRRAARHRPGRHARRLGNQARALAHHGQQQRRLRRRRLHQSRRVSQRRRRVQGDRTARVQAALGRYADWSNWTRRWEPSRLDEVHINEGAAVVDAVGQKAGNIRLGTTAGAYGVLGVESGWLEVSRRNRDRRPWPRLAAN